MEELLEGLFSVIIVIAFAVASQAKKRKKGGARSDSVQPRRTADASGARNVAEEIRRAFSEADEPSQIRAALKDVPVMQKVKSVVDALDIKLDVGDSGKRFDRAVSLPELRPKPLAEGESRIDAEGCIGGTLDDHREEGETRAEHAAHLDRRDAQLREQEAAQSRAEALRRAHTAELRRAVVMKEVLDKPVSLRTR